MTNYAKQYCDAVLNGEIISCNKIKLAAKRFYSVLNVKTMIHIRTILMKQLQQRLLNSLN
ncbi:hypothetical protein [Kurthia senegalensis]|uniref:hypothetical protein n=1 Tax=Kurthia senegalensis TaxID=1033740 RepID=UPI0002DABF0F|nr:hypothetical protein [Kurthia senegalensis]